jgi:hypothetical protein
MSRSLRAGSAAGWILIVLAVIAGTLVAFLLYLFILLVAGT